MDSLGNPWKLVMLREGEIKKQEDEKENASLEYKPLVPIGILSGS